MINSQAVRMARLAVRESRDTHAAKRYLPDSKRSPSMMTTPSNWQSSSSCPAPVWGKWLPPYRRAPREERGLSSFKRLLQFGCRPSTDCCAARQARYGHQDLHRRRSARTNQAYRGREVRPGVRLRLHYVQGASRRSQGSDQCLALCSRRWPDAHQLRSRCTELLATRRVRSSHRSLRTDACARARSPSEQELWRPDASRARCNR